MNHKCASAPLLSICIATLNRSEYLQQTINKFAQQIRPSVELVVLDGGSIDDTQEIMLLYCTKYPWVRYFRESIPSGIDGDYDKCVLNATGEYCWLFSDDDWPVPGALDMVLNACGEDHCFIFVDAEVRDKTMLHLLAAKRSSLTQNLLLSAQETDRVFELAAPSLSFIGSCILKRHLWLARDRESYDGYFFPHIAVLFQTPLPSSSLLIAKSLVAIRHGNATWSAKAFRIWMFLWPQLIWKLQGISDRAKQSVTDRYPWKNPLTLLIARAKGIYTREVYLDLLLPLVPIGLTRLWLSVVSLIPGTILLASMLLASRLIRSSRQYWIAEFKLSPYYRATWMSGLAKN